MSERYKSTRSGPAFPTGRVPRIRYQLLVRLRLGTPSWNDPLALERFSEPVGSCLFQHGFLARWEILASRGQSFLGIDPVKTLDRTASTGNFGGAFCPLLSTAFPFLAGGPDPKADEFCFSASGYGVPIRLVALEH